MNKKFLG